VPSVPTARCFNASSSSLSMLLRSFFGKPYTNIQRLPLLVATSVRKPPRLPCPVRAIRFFSSPPPRRHTVLPSFHARRYIGGTRSILLCAPNDRTIGFYILLYRHLPQFIYSTKCYGWQGKRPARDPQSCPRSRERHALIIASSGRSVIAEEGIGSGQVPFLLAKRAR
jgi:hypothetical protein